jgi:hypothetical protein
VRPAGRSAALQDPATGDRQRRGPGSSAARHRSDRAGDDAGRTTDRGSGDDPSE